VLLGRIELLALEMNPPKAVVAQRIARMERIRTPLGSRAACAAPDAGCLEASCERRPDGAHDLVLEREQIGLVVIVPLRPDVLARGYVDRLNGDDD
jgi:hypothetical protein